MDGGVSKARIIIEDPQPPQTWTVSAAGFWKVVPKHQVLEQQAPGQFFFPQSNWAYE